MWVALEPFLEVILLGRSVDAWEIEGAPVAETSGWVQSMESIHHHAAGNDRHCHGCVFGRRFEEEVHGSVGKLCVLAVSFVCPV